MRNVFVHGWSVTNTDTYAGLPTALFNNAPQGMDLQVQHLYLAKYISFADEVTVDDIARGAQNAIATEVMPVLSPGERFACITHSTGAPVMRTWIDLFYSSDLSACPLSHLIMLAPANHGSALAQLGKGRLARMKFSLEGVDPGTGVLDWLELGSDQSWNLNRRWLSYKCVEAGLYPFVLTGQRIDRAMYDSLNSYTDEAGSDGVVRAAAANLNFGLVSLVQDGDKVLLTKEDHAEKNAFGVLPKLAHSGERLGIMGSVRSDDDGTHPTVAWILRCLAVTSVNAYRNIVTGLAEVTATTQVDEQLEVVKELFVFERTFKTSRYSMLVFKVSDDRDNDLSDYDVVFTAGPNYDPNHLPPGFFVDRQRNLRNSGKLSYYIDYDVMSNWFEKPELEGKFGFRIAARPETGFAYYTVAEYKGTFAKFKKYLEPNQTIMVDVQLQRRVREGVFRLTQSLEPENFKSQLPGGQL